MFRAGAAVAAGALLPACGNKREVEPPAPPPPKPVDAGTVAFPAVDVVELTIAQLGAKLRSGAETSASLVAKYRARVDAMNTKGPMLRAVIELDPDADAHAGEMDRNRGTGPLAGIPILIKDNIDTAGKMMTTAGSLALAGPPAPKDAFVVAKLRAAGALIFGKANLSEWANFRGNSSSAGWSARGGQCRNPYALDRTPSGSSSGSAAAVAASLCAVALGTETDGSITSPAALHGLVGIKPTVGLVSRAGIIPISPSQDTAGPIARCVEDAAIVLTAIAGPDPDDPSTAGAKPEDYSRYLDPKALEGARLGVPRKVLFGQNRRIDAAIDQAMAKLVTLGAVLVDPLELEVPPELQALELMVLVSEMAPAMAAYLARRPDLPMRSLADVVAFNKQHADKEMVAFGQELLEQAVAAKGLDDRAYREARDKSRHIARDLLIGKAMQDHRLDAIIGPTRGFPSLIDQLNGDDAGFSSSFIAAIAGFPHVTVQGGEYLGMPIGLSFFGKAFTEGKLLGYAYAFEQATKLRKPPTYRATVAMPG